MKRAAVGGGPDTTVANPTGISHPNTGLSNGATYYDVVSAVIAGGESAYSSQVNSSPATAGYDAGLATDDVTLTIPFDSQPAKIARLRITIRIVPGGLPRKNHCQGERIGKHSHVKKPSR